MGWRWKELLKLICSNPCLLLYLLLINSLTCIITPVIHYPRYFIYYPLYYYYSFNSLIIIIPLIITPVILFITEFSGIFNWKYGKKTPQFLDFKEILGKEIFL